MRVDRFGRFEFWRSLFVDKDGGETAEGKTASFVDGAGGFGSVLIVTSEEVEVAFGGRPSLGLDPSTAPSRM